MGVDVVIKDMVEVDRIRYGLPTPPSHHYSKSKPSAAELEKTCFYYFNFDGSDMFMLLS